ncbi:2OG-Fe(II) oxygenase [Gymnopus androsaceus JB14]|uniref:2OG-Fe(II) oxygenase n=1 Tax=Gymnopus androsaceus JB14 TaxID=1447944 RepID=A0A6A4GNG3_9AGAR|nr:2OG-Fe(II) oxygenase [Gymnopus androsaceus JB14]
MSAAPPIIDIQPFLIDSSSQEASNVITNFRDAFTTWGFCQLVGHNVPPTLRSALLANAKTFFDLPLEEKLKVHVKNGGVAWRGYMPQGGEGTHGRIDQKEGIYAGPEHPDDHPQIGLPLHGKNQFPDTTIPEMRGVVLEYIEKVSELGRAVCDIISMSLGMDKEFVREKFLAPEPVALFRCFKYSLKEAPKEGSNIWGIGDHSDFGLLTLLIQDSPGLQVLSPQKEWVDVPVIENAFVCNVGDMLDMLTEGRFISARHRVIPPPFGTTRISSPLFFDFSWTANMVPFPLDHLTPLTAEEKAISEERWKTTTFTAVNGQWWQYLAKKVKKVFPTLGLPDFESNVAPSSRFTIEVSA